MSNTCMTKKEQLDWSKQKHKETVHNTICTFHLDKNCGCLRCRGKHEK